jgi:hypothetical protein
MYQSVKLLLCWVLGGPWLAYMAVTNDRGLVLNGILRFSPTGATVFYAVCSGICFIATAFVGLSILRSVVAKKESTERR